MRMSRGFFPTMREVPKEAEIPSHILMLRAGLIRMLSAGLYTHLPLGLRVIQKVSRIVREEMNGAGACEVLMPTLQPDTLWKQTGRWNDMGPELMRLQDRHERDFVLGPTHEEIITHLVASALSSYRDLPKNLYQIQTKFRDEVRPRFGVMRSREFIMKDAYSFDKDEAGCKSSYDDMYQAYDRIFKRCGLDCYPVAADTGVMGGSGSHEFMALADSGEAEIAVCKEANFAVNLEICEVPPVPAVEPNPSAPDAEVVDTPNKTTIEDVTAFLKKKPGELVKTLLFQGGEKVVAVLVRGDRDANPIKVGREMGCLVDLAEPGVVKEITGCEVGYAGPVGLKSDVEIWADPEVLAMEEMTTGANQTGRHILHVVAGRDFKPTRVADLRWAVPDDPCPEDPSKAIEVVRGIEVGQVFQLGTKYSEKLEATFQDEDGTSKPMIMGCYGIGVTRTVAAVIEQHHDEKGIVWPESVAPFHIHLLSLGTHMPEIVEACDKLAESLAEAGFEVLYDDRDERPGGKFKDADLMGIPWQVSIGKKSLEKGVCEITRRSSGERSEVSIEEAISFLKDRSNFQ
ncbi:MAG: proline--tRNA ligase [Candidatus Omnitrophica bacterium]|nr:proline--tRNA ligase [Candidatus Omnitrophota bacterium]